MNKRFYGLLLGLLCLAVPLLSGCAATAVSPLAASVPETPTLSIEEQAAREATAIVARAKATALVLQAEAQATAFVQQAGTVNALPNAAPTAAAVSVDAPANAAASTPVPLSGQVAGVEEEYRIELMDVGYAGEGGFIMVRFRATKKATEDLWQGRVSVTDEATGTVYEEVPVMPKIGPLIGRPRSFGPAGYVMLVNTSPGLPPGSLVTVKLGRFTQEHVQVASK